MQTALEAQQIQNLIELRISLLRLLRNVARDGQITYYTRGKTLYVRPEYDRQIDRRLDAYYDSVYGLPHDMFRVSDAALRSELGAAGFDFERSAGGRLARTTIWRRR